MYEANVKCKDRNTLLNVAMTSSVIISLKLAFPTYVSMKYMFHTGSLQFNTIQYSNIATLQSTKSHKLNV